MSIMMTVYQCYLWLFSIREFTINVLKVLLFIFYISEKKKQPQIIHYVTYLNTFLVCRFVCISKSCCDNLAFNCLKISHIFYRNGIVSITIRVYLNILGLLFIWSSLIYQRSWSLGLLTTMHLMIKSNSSNIFVSRERHLFCVFSPHCSRLSVLPSVKKQYT